MINYYENTQLSKIIMIQNYWRNKKNGERIKYFSQLPDDLWNLILENIQKKYYHKYIDQIIVSRILKIYWEPTSINNTLIKVLKSLGLVKKYWNIIHSNTVHKSFILSQKMLSIPYTNQIQKHMINGFIEHLFYYRLI